MGKDCKPSFLLKIGRETRRVYIREAMDNGGPDELFKRLTNAFLELAKSLKVGKASTIVASYDCEVCGGHERIVEVRVGKNALEATLRDVQKERPETTMDEILQVISRSAAKELMEYLKDITESSLENFMDRLAMLFFLASLIDD